MARSAETPKVELFLNTNTNYYKSYPLRMLQHELFLMVLHRAPSEVMVGALQTSQMGSLQVQLATWVFQIPETPTVLKEVLAVCQQISSTGPREMPVH